MGLFLNSKVNLYFYVGGYIEYMDIVIIMIMIIYQ